MNAGKVKTVPPVLRSYRAVLITVIVVLWILIAVLFAGQAEGLIDGLKSAIAAMHKAWTDMDWSLT